MKSNSLLEYKNYIGHMEFDDESKILYGDVINSRDVITFQGKSVSEIKLEFQKSVDFYLDFCKKYGKKSECSGDFQI